MKPKKRDSATALGLTVTEFCDAFGISTGGYYKLRHAGLAPVEIRIGRVIRISREAIDAWRTARETPTGKEADAVAAERQRLVDRARRAAGVAS